MTKPSLEGLLSRRLEGMGTSGIRDLLSQAGKKDFISLGGGYPAPESFPLKIIDDLDKIVKDKYGPSIRQYGATEGYRAPDGTVPLLEELPNFLKRPNRNIEVSPENIAITAGSQEALTILGMMFLDKGDKVAVESPTYLGAIQAFSPFKPNYIELKTDEFGIIPENLDLVFTENPDIKFLYTVPTFQNPSGRTIPLERRRIVADTLKKHAKFAVEDDPYSELRYEGEHLSSIKSLAPDNVIHLFTFSKTLAPDFRIGGMVASKEIITDANMIKQGLTLFTSNYNQAMVTEYLKGGYIDQHIPKIIKLYRERRNIMAQAIDENFPDIFKYTLPEGGMFLWVNLKKEFIDLATMLNMKKILEEAKRSGIGFVPGAPFFARSNGNEIAMRLNYTNQGPENIVEATRVIGEILQQNLSEISISAISF